MESISWPYQSDFLLKQQDSTEIHLKALVSIPEDKWLPYKDTLNFWTLESNDNLLFFYEPR